MSAAPTPVVAALIALGLAVLVLPRDGTGVAARLGRTGSGRRAPRAAGRAVLELLAGAGRRRCVTAAMLAAFGAAAAGGLLVPGIAAAGIAGMAVHLSWSARDAVARGRAGRAAVEAVGGLVDELRAGRPPHVALATVAAFADPALGWPLADAAREVALGGDPARVLREVDDPRLRQVAAGWELSAAGGCSLAAVLAAVDTDLRSGAQLDRLLASQLSGPRATAGLLAVLPVLGLAMGAAMGAEPWYILTATGPGQLALLLGVGFDLLGVLWTVRLTRMRSP